MSLLDLTWNCVYIVICYFVDLYYDGLLWVRLFGYLLSDCWGCWWVCLVLILVYLEIEVFVLNS